MVKFSITKSLLIFLVSILITIGCDEGNVEIMNTCFLTKSNITYANGGVEEYNFTFNPDNKLIKMVSVYTSANHDVYTYSNEFTYDSNGNVVMETYDDGSVAYTYNSNNQIIREEYFDINSLQVIIENEYNTSGQVIKRQYYSVSSEGEVAEDYYSEIEYATITTKNISRIKKYSQDGTLYSTIEYLYDDKKNPWTNTGLEALFWLRDNNITKETRTEGTSTQSDTYSYEYTKEGYPSQRTRTDNSGMISYTEMYTYVCN